MYSIWADNVLMWRSDYEGYELFNPRWEHELNTAGSLRFDMPEQHPFYGKLQKLKTTIDLLDGGETVWRGRVLTDDGIDFDNVKSVYCEGALSFFNDSIVRPYEWTGGVREYFSFLVSQHNDQVEADRQFLIGECTVTDPNDLIVRANSNYPNTWDEMHDKLLGLLGGYLVVTFEDGKQVINYLAEAGPVSDQVIEFGENLIDITQYIDASEVYTVIVPLGATYEEEVTTGNGSSSASSSTSNSSSNSSSSSGAKVELTFDDVVTALGYTPPKQDTTYSAGSNLTQTGTKFSLTKSNVIGALGFTPASEGDAGGFDFDDYAETGFTQGAIRAARMGNSSNGMVVVGTTSDGVKFSTALSTGWNVVAQLPDGMRPWVNWTGTAMYGSSLCACMVNANGNVRVYTRSSHTASDTLHLNLTFPVYADHGG